MRSSLIFTLLLLSLIVADCGGGAAREAMKGPAVAASERAGSAGVTSKRLAARDLRPSHGRKFVERRRRRRHSATRRAVDGHNEHIALGHRLIELSRAGR